MPLDPGFRPPRGGFAPGVTEVENPCGPGRHRRFLEAPLGPGDGAGPGAVVGRRRRGVNRESPNSVGTVRDYRAEQGGTRFTRSSIPVPTREAWPEARLRAPRRREPTSVSGPAGHPYQAREIASARFETDLGLAMTVMGFSPQSRT
jgi:hypothetical protein